MNLEIGTQLQSAEQPIDEAYLKNLIEELRDDANTPKSWAENVAFKLAKKESRYKFLVLVTEISSRSEDTDLNIKSSVAAVWDSEKDGSITVSIPGEPLKVFTVFWVYAN